MSNNNLAIWDSLKKTDPKHTKPFKRGGGFSGTAIKPIYTEQKMTEEFGPVGIGWGFSEPTFQLVPGDNRELLVYCWVTLWFVRDGVRSEGIPGVGGDKVISYIKANDQYNRPERWENDDEAFKKAFTDAVGNAMKHLGMSADVHMGMFDDSKYVRERTQEEAEAAKPAPVQSKPKLVQPATPFDSPEVEDRVILETMLLAARQAQSVEKLNNWYRTQRVEIEALPEHQRAELMAELSRLKATLGNVLQAG